LLCCCDGSPGSQPQNRGAKIPHSAFLGGSFTASLQDVPEEHIPTFNAMAMTVDPPIIHQAVVSWNSNAAPLFNPHANP
jgi:hypothetical protein